MYVSVLLLVVQQQSVSYYDMTQRIIMQGAPARKSLHILYLFTCEATTRINNVKGCRQGAGVWDAEQAVACVHVMFVIYSLEIISPTAVCR